jgi:glutamyl-tRNA reductase
MTERVPLEIERVLCLSFSSRRGHPAPEREQVALTPEEVETLIAAWTNELKKLGKAHPDAGLVYLGTCHRIEFFSYGINSEDLMALWSQSKGTTVFKAEVFVGIDAIEHWMRVGSSMESEVLGETQVSGQLKDAIETGRRFNQLGSVLDRCSQSIIKSTKKIRAGSKIGEGTVSVAHVAVDGLLDVFESVDRKQALLVGAGSMAIQSLERLFRLGFKNITWVNRSLEKIENHPMAKLVKIAPIGQLPQLVWENHVSVFATSSPKPLLRKTELITPVSPPRAVQGPRIILDLGLPRNVDPEIHRKSDFFVRNVDEFRDQASAEGGRRNRALNEAKIILNSELAAFKRSWQHWSRAPQIAEIHSLYSEWIELTLVDFKLEENSEIGYKVRNLFSKLLHHLLQVLEEVDEDRLVDLVQELKSQSLADPRKKADVVSLAVKSQKK